MKTYRVSFNIGESMLPVVIELLSGTVKDMKVEETGGRHVSRRPSKKLEDQRSVRTVIDHMASKLKSSVSDIGQHLASQGYAAATASPVVSKLAEAGIVRRLPGGLVEYLKKNPVVGATGSSRPQGEK